VRDWKEPQKVSGSYLATRNLICVSFPADVTAATFVVTQFYSDRRILTHNPSITVKKAAYNDVLNSAPHNHHSRVSRYNLLVENIAQCVCYVINQHSSLHVSGCESWQSK